MFAAIYQGYIKLGMEADYQEAWRKIAKYFVEQRGAIGSALHKAENGLWVAYSRWPDKVTRDASWPKDSTEASIALPSEIRDTISSLKACIDSERQIPELSLELMDDLLFAKGPGPVAHYQAKLQYEIDAWDLDQALRKNEPLIVVDTRSQEAYDHEHIPSAMHFPHKTMSQDSTAERLDPKFQYITYCDGIGCNASTKGALKLAQLGYKVKELIGGIDWWKRDGYPVQGKGNQNCQLQSVIDCGCE